nr:MAG TPA: hypothetical protein [Caudoviricetes sp.]
MKKDRKRRKEAVKRLEKLEDMNRAGEKITESEFIGALYPKYLFDMWRGKRGKESCAEFLEEVKSLVDITDYITCPRTKEKKAIHIGDIVYEVGGDGEPLAVEEIFISHYGSMVECKSLSGKWLSYRPQRLTFDDPREIVVRLKDEAERVIYARHELQDALKRDNFSLDDFLYPF